MKLPSYTPLLLLALGTPAALAQECVDESCAEQEDVSLGPRCPGYMGQVERVEWPQGKPFAQAIAEARRPIVLTNSVVNKWFATNKWTREYIVDRMKDDPPNVDVRTQAATIKNDKTPLGELSIFTIRSHSRNGETLEVPGEIINGNYTLERKNLLSVAQDKTEEVDGEIRQLYSYHSGPIQKWKHNLEEELQPWDDLRAVDPLMHEVAGRESSHGIIHFGEEGVVAQMHHDRNRNFFGQLVGRKRVLLFDPASQANMYTFPITHPSRRQSQVHFFNGDGDYDKEQFPRFQHARCWETVIGPGDLLYIPPFWGHMVQYLDFASSFSIVSPSLPEWMFSKVYYNKLPLSNLETKHEKAMCMVKYLALVLKELAMMNEFTAPEKGYDDAERPNFIQWAPRLVDSMINTRFGPLKSLMQASYDPEYSRTSDGSACWYMSHISKDRLLAVNVDITPKIGETAKKVRDLLVKGTDSMVGMGFLSETEVMMTDWIEEYARHMVGAKHVPRFLECLLENVNLELDKLEDQ